MIGYDSAPPTNRSFRDPAGAVFQRDGRILRAVYPHATADLESFLQTPTAQDAMNSGKLVRSVRVASPEYLVEHERIPFASYPYEWPAEMLHAAAELTLELARAALSDGFGIKDATPYNILFRAADPVFIDVLSFERRDPNDATWVPYAQFVRTFLLPLLAARHFGMPLDRTLAGQRDGLDPDTVYRWTRPFERLRSPFLKLVSIPKWLGSREANYKPQPSTSPGKARFILDGLLKSCQRDLDRVKPVAADSNWSGYLDHKSLYSPEQLAQKEAFVSEALEIARPSDVLDAGANEGHFSFLAAKHGASVVAIDSDPAVVGSIWRRARRDRAAVLPLVVDLTRPTPAIGWRNQECESFLGRARGRFDMVMMLAVIHHVLVTERIPLEEIFALVEEISRKYVLIEFVAPEDPMFQKIVRGRDALYSRMTKEWFEAAAAERFDLVRTRRIDGLQRWLYLFRRRRVTN